MKKYYLIIIVGLYFGLSPLLAQDDEELPIPTIEEVLRNVKERRERDKHLWTEETLQARNATYIRSGSKKEMAQEIRRSTNKMSDLSGLQYMYCPSFIHNPLGYRVLDGDATLWSLAYRVYPYIKDRLPTEKDSWYYKFLSLGIISNLDKKTIEVGFSSNVGFEGVPVDIFERVEAEVFENGVRMDFDVEAFKSMSCGSTGYVGILALPLRGYKSELWHRVESWYSQRQYPQMGSGTGNSPLDESHQDLLHQIIMWNIAFDSSGTINWDKYTFRYYHPTIIYRLLVDVGTGGYTKIGDSKVAYREGKYSHLLLPDDSRYIADRSERTSLMTLKNQRYYEVLLDPVYLAEMSPEQFATELVSRLCQAYIAYELAIEGRIIPSVKAHLDAVNWYEGRFADLLAYYAQTKGLSLDALRTTYVREQKEILSNVLYESDSKELERLLWQTLGN